MKLLAKYHNILKTYCFCSLISSKYRNSDHNYVRPLVICDAGIGDLLLATPVIKKLAELSCAPVDLVTNRKSFEIIEHNPYVGRVFILESWSNAKLIEQLNQLNYSIVISVRAPLFLLKGFGIKGTHGVWVSNPYYERLRFVSRSMSLISRKYKQKYYTKMHMVEVIGSMLENINMTQIDHLPQMYPSKYDIESASEIIESINSYVVIHVGGQDEIRKLRTETLIEVIDKMHLPCVLVGGMEDSIRSSEITAKCKNTLDLTGKISLNQLYVILLSSSLCIAPDSSVMHIASVAGTKLIAIMGNAFPQTYGPFPVHSNIRILTRYPECSPCSRKMCDKYCGYSCLQDITQNEIMHCVNQLL